MSNLLKNITNSLLEAEDDLFPGLTSSAFDEHNKLKVKRPQLEELDRVEGQLERLDALRKSSDDRISRMLQDLRKQKLFLPKWQTVAGQVMYETLPWIAAKFPAAAKALEGFSFDSTINSVNSIPPVVAKIDQAFGRREQIKQKLKKMRAKGTRLRKVASSSEIDRQKKENPVGTIPESQIPKQFRAVYFGDQYMKHGGEWKTEDFNNPYFEDKANTSVITHFAGHPAHFQWQKREITQYLMLSNFVKKLGLPELSVLYLKRIVALNNGKESLRYYMANSDKSFQFTRSQWGSNTIYTKDTRINNYNTNFNISFIIDAKKEIAETVDALKKFKGKKP